MNREEAEEWLKSIKERIHGGDERYDKKRHEAIDMAISALEQEPCDELSQECVEPTQKHVGNALKMRCDDVVSREKAVRCVLSSMFLAEASEKIEQLPSVRPQEPKILNTLDFAIDASNGDTNYFVGFRNGLRYAKSLVDGEEPQYERCAEQEQTGHWIPTSEMLPNKRRWVLVTTESYQKPVEIMCYQGRQIGQHNVGNGWGKYGFPSWTSGHGDIQSHHPKAWMPLPEPYKVDPQESEDCEEENIKHNYGLSKELQEHYAKLAEHYNKKARLQSE